MTMRLSTGLRNFLNKRGSIDDAMRNGRIEIYSGPQPTSADAAVSGTLLCTISAGGAAITNEVLASGTVTLAGSSGSVDTITVGGVNVLGASIPFNGTLAQTALDVAAQINRNKTVPDYTASASAAVVTITALPGSGTSANSLTITGTLTTLTASYVNTSGGVNPANGLLFEDSVAGVMNKRTGQSWTGTNAASGSAGWFRQYGSVADVGALDSAAAVLRIDGAVATAGGELNLSTTNFVAAAVSTLASWALTVPGA